MITSTQTSTSLLRSLQAEVLQLFKRSGLAVRDVVYLLVLLFALLFSVTANAAWQTPNMPTDTISTNTAIPAPGITTTINNAYFKITQDDVAKAVADQLQIQAVERKAEVALAIGTPGILYSADHPLKLTIHSLQIDTNSKRWQAQAYILANGKTETVKPVSGTYMGMVDVPVVTRQLGHSDVIEAKDLTIKAFPERQLRKDTVIDAKQLIGQSPRSMITPERPIRMAEISSPILIKRNEPVQLTYTNPYMSLKATGTALQDGARGDMVRIKNDKSQKAVTGRVTGAGTVEVNSMEATIAPVAPAPIAPAALAPAAPAPQPILTTPPLKPAQQ